MVVVSMKGSRKEIKNTFQWRLFWGTITWVLTILSGLISMLFLLMLSSPNPGLFTCLLVSGIFFGLALLGSAIIAGASLHD